MLPTVTFETLVCAVFFLTVFSAIKFVTNRDTELDKTQDNSFQQSRKHAGYRVVSAGSSPAPSSPPTSFIIEELPVQFAPLHETPSPQKTKATRHGNVTPANGMKLARNGRDTGRQGIATPAKGMNTGRKGINTLGKGSVLP